MHARLVSAYLDALRRKSPEALGELYAEEAELADPQARLLVGGEGDALKGRERILRYHRELFKSDPRGPAPRLVSLVSHRHHAVLETIEFRRRFCHVMEVRSERIVSHRVYWGSLPSPFVLDKLLRLEE